MENDGKRIDHSEHQKPLVAQLVRHSVSSPDTDKVSVDTNWERLSANQRAAVASYVAFLVATRDDESMSD